MNKAKWNNAPMSRLIVKFAEETGEVAKAYLDVLEASTPEARHNRKLAFAKEIGDVDFILDLIEIRLALSGDDDYFDAKNEGNDQNG